MEITSRICTTCKEEKHFSSFHKNNRTKHGICARCKDCYSKITKAERLEERLKRLETKNNTPLSIETHRVCTKCKVNKPFSEFIKAKGRKYDITSKCKPCYNEHQRGYRKLKQDRLKNPEKYKTPEGKRICTRCGNLKDNELFYKNRFSKSGFTSRCIECEKETDKLERISKKEPEIFTVINCKICNFCHTEKHLTEFSKSKNGKYGRASCCKVCVSAYYNKNIERFKSQKKRYREINKDKLKEAYKKKYLENSDKVIKKVTEYAKSNRDKINNWRRNKMKSDINFKIASGLRGRLHRAIKGKSKELKATELLGCSIEEFKNYISSKFEPGMSWDNYGLYTWHIDHCIGVNNFDLTDIEQVKKCFHYSNMSPRWATTKVARKNNSKRIGNINKSDKIIGVDIFEPLS